MARKKAIKDSVTVHGFFRLRIVEEKNGKTVIVGRTPWIQNLVTNVGFANGIVDCLAGIGGSSQVTYVALGTGTAPGATDVTLNGEITDVAGARCAVTPTNVSSKTAQFAFTLNSGVYTANHTIQNVGLFQTSTTAAGSLYAGQTYTTSQLQSNQAVNGSYQLRFS
jgi:hypothetical protein